MAVFRRRRPVPPRIGTSPLYNGTNPHREEPFLLTFLKVGSTLAVLLGVAYFSFLYKRFVLTTPSSPQDERVRIIQKAPIPRNISMEEENGLDRLPDLTLQKNRLVEWDVFAVGQRYFSPNASKSKQQQQQQSSPFVKTAQNLQDDFTHRYGGIRSSRYLLQQSLQSSDETEAAWTRRLHDKQQTATGNKEWHIVTLGQGRVAGYGNYHQQAFPFVLDWTLQKAFAQLGMHLTVTNAALEHLAVFPHLWCLDEFLPKQNKKTMPIDVLYVDFGVLSSTGLELLVRFVIGFQQQQQQQEPPLLVLWESRQNPKRLEVLQHYVELGLMVEPVLVDWTDAVSPFLQVKPSKRPMGFAQWNDFGNARHKKSHDKSLWTIAQHELTAGLLSMHTLKHLQLLVAHDMGAYTVPESPTTTTLSIPHNHNKPTRKDETTVLPYPVLAKASELKEAWSDLLYFGNDRARVHCRTSFDPSDSLASHIAEGGIEGDVLSVHHPKGALFYNSGWVLDMEDGERREKQLSEHLGFVDTQKTYNGIPASGRLTLSLPPIALQLVVVCESQAPPRQEACDLAKDVSFVWIMGKEEQPASRVERIQTDAVSYRGKRHCVVVGLPEESLDTPKTKRQRRQPLRLGIEVSNTKVTLSKGPCSISHVVWAESL